MKDEYLVFKEEFEWDENGVERYEDRIWTRGFLVGATIVGLGSILGMIVGWFLL